MKILPEHLTIFDAAKARTPPGYKFVDLGDGSCAWITDVEVTELRIHVTPEKQKGADRITSTSKGVD